MTSLPRLCGCMDQFQPTPDFERQTLNASAFVVPLIRRRSRGIEASGQKASNFTNGYVELRRRHVLSSHCKASASRDEAWPFH